MNVGPTERPKYNNYYWTMNAADVIVQKWSRPLFMEELVGLTVYIMCHIYIP